MNSIRNVRTIWATVEGRRFLVKFDCKGWLSVAERTPTPGPYGRVWVGNATRLHRNHHERPRKGLYAQVIKEAEGKL